MLKERARFAVMFIARHDNLPVHKKALNNARPGRKKSKALLSAKSAPGH
jgi:hypothetical protein